MSQSVPARTRSLTVLAQDESFTRNGAPVTARVTVPAEPLDPGPRGYRVYVVDYDATRRRFYAPAELGDDGDRFDPPGSGLVGDFAFHAQNVYALVMLTLARFEFALGRRVSWGFAGHQLLVAPHAFLDANAFYSERDRGLFFGYFPDAERQPVFTCLSHDVVVHETTHALLDGLRDRYTDPTLPDQGGFHEGFSDLMALLSVLSMPEVVETCLADAESQRDNRVTLEKLTEKELRGSVLFRMAESMGSALGESRALRASLQRPARRDALQLPEFQAVHNRGEILVAAVMGAYLKIWVRRLAKLGGDSHGRVDLERAAADGADAARHLQKILVRALDYCPPLDLEYGDFLSALLTADYELVPRDEQFGFRASLREAFDAWGIAPASQFESPEPGLWESPEYDMELRRMRGEIRYDRIHLESLQRDADEVFHFAWENRKQLRLFPGVYTRVTSLRPCTRVGPDGFVLREYVAEYIQLIDLTAAELRRTPAFRDLQLPADLRPGPLIRLEGGGTLIFDQYGELKFHVRKRVDDLERQARKLNYMFEQGWLDARGGLGFLPRGDRGQHFAALHRRRTQDFVDLKALGAEGK